MDPQVTEKLVQEMANFNCETGDIGGVALLKGICDVWDTIYNFQARDGDIVVVSYPKSGTTWMQEILDLIVQGGDVEKSMRAPGFVKVPFLEMGHTSLAVADNLPSPRVLKSHLPVQLMPPSFWEKDVKIVYVARNPKDCMVSYYYFYKMDQTLPDPGTWDNFFSMFMAGNVTWGSWFDHVLGWWKAKDKHKILYVFYEDMIEDSRREVQKVVRFLGEDFSEDVVQKILQHTSFKAMKSNPMANFTSLPDSVFDQSVTSFMRKGIVGDWKNHFLESQNIVFDEEYKKKMEGSGLVFRMEL
ncbi:sulfotransferase 1C1-like [Bufo bufo]|uniref:sulfotransferase 1C1-like n=1 Tax=Bufo bufo TaxID=8384 RepID=UPI001ABDBE8E|nr:sulfotransferase 1C1-like [Bufo bufo]